MLTKTFSALGRYVVEFYQSGKFIGYQIHEGVVPINQVGYENKQILYTGSFQLKKKFIATESQPITVIKYNLNGKYQ